MKIINILTECIFQLAKKGSVSQHMKNHRCLKTVDIFVTKQFQII